MIVLEGLLLILGYYLFCLLGMYAYSIFKTWEYTGLVRFGIKDGYIGICKYPKFTFGWIESTISKVKSFKKGR